MSRLPADFRAGVKAVLPLLVGVVPFALVAGVAAVDAGLSVVQAVGMSVVVFAGASQLATIDLLGRDAPLAVVVLTAAVVNLRMMMYSASIAPHFRRLSTRWKAGLSYLLTDQAYALSIAEYTDDETTDRRLFYLGAAASLWVVWQLGTVTGALVGAGVPDSWGLEFAVPLVFLALLVPAMNDRPSVAAAVVGAAVAIVAAGVPYHLGLLVGAVAGILAGLGVESVGGDQ